MSDFVIDPTLRSPTAEDIGRRVKERLEGSSRPKTWTELHGFLAPELVDTRVSPRTGLSADLIGKEAFLALLDRHSAKDHTPENLSFCKLAAEFAGGLQRDQVSRQALLSFLGTAKRIGLTRSSGFSLLSVLSERASTGI